MDAEVVEYSVEVGAGLFLPDVVAGQMHGRDRDGLGHAAIEDVVIVLDSLRRLAACVARPGAGFEFRIPSLIVPIGPSSK